MDGYLKKATSANVTIGPFKDYSNAVSAETGANPSVAVNKNGSFGARDSSLSVAHQQFGYFTCPLGSADTNTVGRLKLTSDDPTTFLPVWHDFVVLPSNVYDSLVGGSDSLEVDAIALSGVNAQLAIFQKCDSALRTLRLHEFIADPGGHPAHSSLLDRIMNIDGTTQTFNRATDSLEAIRSNQAGADTSAIASAVVVRVDDVVESARADLATDIESARADLATDISGLDDPTAAAIADAVWDESAAAHVATGSFGRALGVSNAIIATVESARGDLATDIAALDFATEVELESARAFLATDIAALDFATQAELESARADLAADIAGLDFATQAELESARADLSADIAGITGGGASAASVATEVWHYSVSGSMVSGQAGYVLQSGAENAGAVVSGAVSSADISNIAVKVWDKSRSAHDSSGSFGEALNLEYGTGNVPVNHNTGGTNALQLVDSDSNGIDEARIRIYKASDYNSGLITVPYIQGQSITDASGRWKHPVYLDSGVKYTIVYSKPGSIEVTTKEVTI